MNYWIFRAYLFIRQSKFTTLKLIPFFFHIRWLSSRWHITTKTEYSINLWLNMRKLDKSILLCLKTNLHSVKSERKKEAQMIYNEQENSGFNLTQSILNSFVIESHSLRGAFRLFYFKLSCKARQSFSSIPKKCSSHWVLNTVLLNCQTQHCLNAAQDFFTITDLLEGSAQVFFHMQKLSNTLMPCQVVYFLD